MESIFKEYLFNKHVLVSERFDEHEVEAFNTYVSLARLFGIKVVQGRNLLDSDMISFVSEQLGENVPKPFYRGFPESVKKLSENELLFDQLIHYVNTYGFGNFNEAGHSIFEEDVERLAFHEKTSVKTFICVTEEEAVKILRESMDNFFSSTRPINMDQFFMIRRMIDKYFYFPNECASKDTAVKMLLWTTNTEWAKFLKLPDVIKVASQIQYDKYGSKKMNKLNWRNKDRKFITGVLDIIWKEGVSSSEETTCFEKQKTWCGLLHHIHYIPKTTDAVDFMNEIRSGFNDSVYSYFEGLMKRKSLELAAQFLKCRKGDGALLRNLNYILSRCTNEMQVRFIIGTLGSSNGIVLLQLLDRYSKPEEKGARTFKFTRFNLLKIHPETPEEVRRRKSYISEEVRLVVYKRLNELIMNYFTGKIDKVYIDPEMEKITLPIEESTSSGGFGVLPKGSIIDIPEGKKIRAFTYWEKVDDIDLSVIGLREKSTIEFSWRSMCAMRSDAITFSGDEVAGYNGGSEYFDIKIDKFMEMHPDVTHLVFFNNVYSRSPFKDCFCKAGFMMRDEVDSGDIFEPKTVATSFMIDADTTFACLFAIDLKARQMLWLNLGLNSRAIVAGETFVTFVKDYFKKKDVMNMKKFFSMMAKEVVTDPNAADVIVSDKIMNCSEGKELIHSYDFDKVLKYMNS